MKAGAQHGAGIVAQEGAKAACPPERMTYTSEPRFPAPAVCRGGETGRRTGLKIQRGKLHAGSIPALGTIPGLSINGDRFML